MSTAIIKEQFNFIPDIDKKCTNEKIKALTKMAQSGDADAQFNLGELYADGAPGILANETQAWRWTRMAVDQGHTLAMAHLLSMHDRVIQDGSLYLPPLGGIDYDDARARTISALENLVSDENTSAMFWLGVLLIGMTPKQDDLRHACEHLTLASNKGYAPAMTAMGSIQIEDEDDDACLADGIALLEKSWAKREAFAGLHLGLHYLHTGDEPERGFKYLQEAAELGSAHAAYQVGVCKVRGHGAPKCLDAAFRWLKLSADAHDKEGLFGLFSIGKEQSVPDDVRMIWLKESAERGHPPAMRIYGWKLVDDGQDVELGVDFVTRAAMKDDGYAQLYLGRYCSRGEHLPKNFRAAVRWFQKSLENECTEANVDYGLALMRGDGIEQDFSQAEEFLTEGLKLGFPYAAVGLSYVSVYLHQNYVHALGYLLFSFDQMGPPPSNLKCFSENIEQDLDDLGIASALDYSKKLSEWYLCQSRRKKGPDRGVNAVQFAA
jgi:uncharacterized protein